MGSPQFINFMKGTLNEFAKLIHVREEILDFSDKPFDALIYTRELKVGDRFNDNSNNDDDYYYVAAALPCEKGDAVLCQAVQSVADLFYDSLYLNTKNPDHYFYDEVEGKWHTQETLAKQLYAVMCHQLLAKYSYCTGIDFSYIAQLAEMKYETDESLGLLVFYTGDKSPECTASFSAGQKVEDLYPFNNDVKLVRKLLAGSRFSPDSSDEEKKYQSGLIIYRVAREKPYYCFGYVNGTSIDHFPISVIFHGEGRWSLRFGETTVFKARAERIYCAIDSLEWSITELVKELGMENERFRPAIREIAKQKHGTSILFLDLKQEVSERRISNLAQCKRAFPLNHLNILSEEVLRLLPNLARVDGALVVDYPKGELSYMGAILDGKATPGILSSGAKGNALKCAIANLVMDNASGESVVAAALVFSESGSHQLLRASEIRDELKCKGII